jgi:hypothetical protein
MKKITYNVYFNNLAQPYKIEKFKNVESKLKSMTKMEIPTKPHTTENILKSKNTKNLPKNETTRAKSKQIINRTSGEENIFSLINNKPNKSNIKVHNTEEEKFDYHTQRQPLKGRTPKAGDINTLKPKINKNHIKDNRLAIINHEAPTKLTNTKEEIKIDQTHKDFGKTPE